MATATPSVTPPGVDMAPADVWYAYKTSSGDYGLAKGGFVPHDAIRSVVAGTGATLGALASNFPTEISAALKELGVPGKLWTQLIAQLDVGAVLRNPNFVQVGPKGPSSDKSTSIGSSAVPSNILPSPSIPSPSSILGVLGDLAFWKGIGLVLAGVGILVIAALEIKKL